MTGAADSKRLVVLGMAAIAVIAWLRGSAIAFIVFVRFLAFFLMRVGSLLWQGLGGQLDDDRGVLVPCAATFFTLGFIQTLTRWRED
jgi:hypothetical protein